MPSEAVFAARKKIDARLDSLEVFSFDLVGDDEIDTLTNLLCTFHPGAETPARFATIEQVRRAERAVPRILSELIPQVVKPESESQSARNLVYRELGPFLTSIAKLTNTREAQSASGRGACGRETVAKLRAERDAALAERDAALQKAKEAEREEEAA